MLFSIVCGFRSQVRDVKVEGSLGNDLEEVQDQVDNTREGLQASRWHYTKKSWRIYDRNWREGLITSKNGEPLHVPLLYVTFVLLCGVVSYFLFGVCIYLLFCSKWHVKIKCL